MNLFKILIGVGGFLLSCNLIFRCIDIYNYINNIIDEEFILTKVISIFITLLIIVMPSALASYYIKTKIIKQRKSNLQNEQYR